MTGPGGDTNEIAESSSMNHLCGLHPRAPMIGDMSHSVHVQYLSMYMCTRVQYEDPSIVIKPFRLSLEFHAK